MCTVIEEPYRSEVNNEYVIRGNSVVFKCSIPPFIADFVTVLSWQDDNGNVYRQTSSMDESTGATVTDDLNVRGTYSNVVASWLFSFCFFIFMQNESVFTGTSLYTSCFFSSYFRRNTFFYFYPFRVRR